MSDKKKVVCGLDYVRDADWNPIVRTKDGAVSWGKKNIGEDLKRLGFGVSVSDCGEYYRVSYGRKV